MTWGRHEVSQTVVGVGVDVAGTGAAAMIGGLRGLGAYWQSRADVVFAEAGRGWSDAEETGW